MWMRVAYKQPRKQAWAKGILSHAPTPYSCTYSSSIHLHLLAALTNPHRRLQSLYCTFGIVGNPYSNSQSPEFHSPLLHKILPACPLCILGRLVRVVSPMLIASMLLPSLTALLCSLGRNVIFLLALSLGLSRAITIKIASVFLHLSEVTSREEEQGERA